MSIYTRTLPPSAPALDKLVEPYKDRLWDVKQLGKHTFQACLTDGVIAIAMLLGDGTVKTWELEG